MYNTYTTRPLRCTDFDIIIVIICIIFFFDFPLSPSPGIAPRRFYNNFFFPTPTTRDSVTPKLPPSRPSRIDRNRERSFKIYKNQKYSTHNVWTIVKKPYYYFFKKKITLLLSIRDGYQVKDEVISRDINI